MLHLVATGGTVSGLVGADGTYAAQGSAADLLAQLAGAGDIAATDFTTKLSFEVTLPEWLSLVERLRLWDADSSVSGIVVTQGTALLEEVPFLASLFVAPAKPIVFTGAMQPLSQSGSDGVRNLLDAVTVARRPEAARYGPLVVAGRRVIEAAAVHKAHRSSPAAFEAVGPGLVGTVDAAGVEWLRPPAPPRGIFRDVRLATPVPVAKMALGISPDDLRPIISAELAGLVVEGFPGGGGVPGDCSDLLIELARSIPVVLSSRSLGGRLVRAAGGKSGGGTLLAAGLIDSGSAAPVRARLVAMAAIANDTADDPIAAVRAALDPISPSRSQIGDP